jgi:hypothetical protein
MKLLLSLLTSGFWSFSQILMGLSRDPLPMFRLGVASPLLVGESLKLVHAYKSKGRRELKNLKSFWSFSQILMGLSRDPLSMFRLEVASPLLEVGESLKLVHAYKSKGRRELKNLKNLKSFF